MTHRDWACESDVHLGNKRKIKKTGEHRRFGVILNQRLLMLLIYGSLLQSCLISFVFRVR